MIAQTVLLLCFPIWSSGRKLEAVLIGSMWILATIWFCGSTNEVSIDESSRSIRRSRTLFGVPIRFKSYTIADGDSLFVVLRQDSEDRIGRHVLYLQNSGRKIQLLELAETSFEPSQSLLSSLRKIADTLGIENCVYR